MFIFEVGSGELSPSILAVHKSPNNCSGKKTIINKKREKMGCYCSFTFSKESNFGPSLLKDIPWVTFSVQFEVSVLLRF